MRELEQAKRKPNNWSASPQKHSRIYVYNVIIHPSLPSVKDNSILILEVEYSYVKFNIQDL